ncbi:hypothetical protein H5410_045296 [Solanum commersonii]|uniref:Uncharacterized protein n=1 Tax=Solanum commersonii TaxID=4109 RepID=A0A9J5XC94_SOLCO|nr:hypothetical protein H5410_045296 [Solanum commersonii]
MLDQIAKLTIALTESEQIRVVEQESMSATVQQIKEQVLNLDRRHATSSLVEDINDVSEEDDDDFIRLYPLASISLFYDFFEF